MVDHDIMKSFDKYQEEAKEINKRGFRIYQLDQWAERSEDLLHFKAETGHCLVPHDYPPNQKLARWVKRQRYQYKLKNTGRASTSSLCDDRVRQLEAVGFVWPVGFVWDSHQVNWYEKIRDLQEYYRAQYGDCRVPPRYHDRSLAIWVQWKLYQQGEHSTLNEERIAQSDAMGFEWNPRGV
jgi:hypothetical protein